MISTIRTVAIYAVTLIIVTTARPVLGASISRQKAEQVAALGRVWSIVHYFHPWLTYKDLSWKDAIAEAIPKALSCQSEAECQAVVKVMLSRLGDPATDLAVADPTESQSAVGGFVTAELIDGGVLLVASGALKKASDDAWPRFAQLLPQAKSVLFDLRGGPVHPWTWEGAARLVVAEELAWPGHRSRFHSGLSLVRGNPTAPHFAGSLVRQSAVSRPLPGARTVPVVFLTPNEAALPIVAAALQYRGTGYIVSEVPVSDARFVRRHRVSTAAGVDAVIRLSEIVYADGSSGFKTDEIATGDGMARALSAARESKHSTVTRSAIPLALTQRIDDDYPRETYPSREYRLISVFKIWAVFQYFFPYRDLMTADWDEALLQAIPRVIEATNDVEYHLAVAEMVAAAADTHAQVASPILERFFGAAHPAIRVRPVEGQVVVTDILDAGASPGIQVGDIVAAVDGERIDDKRRKLSKLLAASTPQALDRDVVNRVLRGPEGTQVELEVMGGDGVKHLVKTRRSAAFLRGGGRKGDSASHPMSYKMLSPGIGYIDLRLLTLYDVEAAFLALRDTQAIIFDMRGYPNGTGWAVLHKLRLKLAPQGAQLYRRLVLDPSSDSRQSFIADIPSDFAAGEGYSGKTVLLIDARAQSQSEATANMFRANAGTTVIGSPSVGANGDGAHFVVAGSIDIGLTGMGAKNPDGTQLQRRGVIPDIQASPTITGIREGRDEVLERALQFISTGK